MLGAHRDHRPGEVWADRAQAGSDLPSLGIPACFLHPADGAHGDVEMVARGDVLVALSNCDETEEIRRPLPIADNRFGLQLIAIAGNPHATLAKRSDVVLNVQVSQEARPSA